MDYIRDRKSNISFSLHDSRILQIEINEDKLSLNEYYDVVEPPVRLS